MSGHYRPGTAAVLVSDRGLVATDREHAAALATLAGTDLFVLSVIDTLSGGSLPDLPGFACVTVEGDDLRLVVRGDFTVAVGEGQWTGADVATWRELTVPGGATATVSVVAGSVVAGSAQAAEPDLPIEAGVVLAASVTWTAGPASAATGRSATLSDLIRRDAPSPAPVVPPAPTAEEPTVEEPTVEEPVVHEPAVEQAESVLGDHDGRTITAAQLRALRERAAGLDGAPRAAVVLPSGDRYDVAPRLLIGRRPQARQVANSEVPTLVTVEDPYISGTHLEVALQDGQVLVTDVSTNGTLLIRPGETPTNLEKGVAVPVLDGTRLSLSDNLTVAIELEVGG